MSDAHIITEIAKAFHESYERQSPNFGYETREASAVPWEDVPSENRLLLEAVVRDLYDQGVIEAPGMTAGRIDATMKTLRYAAGLVFSTDEDMAKGLYEAAEQMEKTTDIADWWTCPVCEESRCDDGCPLATHRQPHA